MQLVFSQDALRSMGCVMKCVGDAELLDAEQLHKLTSRASVSMALHASHGGKGRCSLTGLGVLPLLLWIESVTSTSTLPLVSSHS